MESMDFVKKRTLPWWYIYIYLGGVFLIMLIIQHIGGVSTYLQGIKFNPAHRKFAVVVTNMGRFIAFFGLVIA